jgi:hypothetical protein
MHLLQILNLQPVENKPYLTIQGDTIPSAPARGSAQESHAGIHPTAYTMQIKLVSLSQ